MRANHCERCAPCRSVAHQDGETTRAVVCAVALCLALGSMLYAGLGSMDTDHDKPATAESLRRVSACAAGRAAASVQASGRPISQGALRQHQQDCWNEQAAQQHAYHQQLLAREALAREQQALARQQQVLANVTPVAPRASKPAVGVIDTARQPQ